jgi:hypothetical protein
MPPLKTGAYLPSTINKILINNKNIIKPGSTITVSIREECSAFAIKSFVSYQTLLLLLKLSPLKINKSKNLKIK